MKKIIVIGIQHSGTRYVCNVLTKHPDIEFKYHISIPSGNSINPLEQNNIIKFNSNDHVIFVNREISFCLDSNDKSHIIEGYKRSCDIGIEENICCDINILKNYEKSINKCITEKLIPMNIPFSFFSMETYNMYKEFYLKDFFENNLKLNYDLYPKNLSGRYHFMNRTLKINDDGHVINEKGEVIDTKPDFYFYLNIEIKNTNEKYYSEKKFLKTNGDIK